MVTGENLFAVSAFDAEHAWAVGFSALIAHTSDGGTTWEIQNSGVTVPLYDVSFVNPQAGWIAGGRGTILHTADGGKTWKPQTSGTNRQLFGIDFADEMFGWAVGEFDTILHTADGGATWVSQGSGEDRIYNDVYFIDRRNGWVAGEYGLIYHTRDGGSAWELQMCQDIVCKVDETQWETPTPSLYSLWFTDALKGKDGFKDYTAWWNSTFEWNVNPQRMADYVKRVVWMRFFTQEEIDFLFNLTKQYPAVADAIEAGVYNYTEAVMNHFLSMPGLSPELQEKCKTVKQADIAKIATVLAKRAD